MQNIWADIRYAIRMLQKSPGFTGVAVLTLALGIGANTAMFSVVNNVVLNPLPLKNASCVVLIWWSNKALDTAEGTATLESAANYQPGSLNLTGSGAAERIPAAEVSENFFRVFAIAPVFGRTFSAAEEKAGHAPVVLVSERLWRSRYGADRDIFSKSVYLNGKPYAPIGILPGQFDFPSGAQVWLPAPPNTEEAFGGNVIFRYQLGRLREGATVATAKTELQAMQDREPQSNSAAGLDQVRVESLRDYLVGDTREAALLLFGAVGFVLLIACADVANLLLARGAGRSREVAVRRAMGATRLRLVRQFLSESLLLSLCGGGFGLLCGWWALEASRAFVPARSAFTSQVVLDSRVLAFTCAIAILTGIIAGIVPALQSTAPDISEVLKEGTRSSRGGFRFGSHRTVRNLFGIAEIALALILAIGATLFLHSLVRLLDVSPGFRTDNMLVARLSLLGPKYNRTAATRTAFLEQVLARTRVLPGVRAAAFTNEVPLDTSALMAMGVESVDSRKVNTSGQFYAYMTVSPAYFRAIGIPLLAGRDFDNTDTNPKRPVAIISERMAQDFWPKRSPIGAHFSLMGSKPRDPAIEIVGVAGDVKQMGLSEQTMAAMYFPATQQAPDQAALIIHAAANPLALTDAVRQVIRDVDPDEPVSSFKTMHAVYSDSIARPRFRSLLLTIFGGLALLLAWVGVYSVISYTVAQRTHEIGIRMALGASRRDILNIVAIYGLKLAAVGISAGLVGAFLLARLAATFLYGIQPTDPEAFVVGCAVLAVVVFLASHVPARRAMRVDPIVALRYE